MDAGLLQFGWFDAGAPFKLHLDMLPAYPDVLKAVATTAKPFAQDMSRLVCLADALPLGVALSLETNIPLVYSRGSESEAVHDLVGAYDIGHPALLVLNQLTQNDSQSITDLALGAHRVGLDIRQTVAIIAVDTQPDANHSALLNLADVVETLTQAGRVPAGQAQAVKSWLLQQQH